MGNLPTNLASFWASLSHLVGEGGPVSQNLVEVPLRDRRPGETVAVLLQLMGQQMDLEW